MRNFRKYDIWIDSIKMVDEIYDVIDRFPDTEKYGLHSQMGRCVISIPSNIAEGAGRKSEKEYARFLEISLGSSFELETQLIVSKNRKFLTEERFEDLLTDLHSIQKRISGFIIRLRS